MLEGTVELRNGPATVGEITDIISIPFAWANLKAASSVRIFDRTYTYNPNSENAVKSAI